MASRAGPSRSLHDFEISEYLDIDNLSDVSGVGNDIGVLDFSDEEGVGVSVQDVFVSSRAVSPVEEGILVQDVFLPSQADSPVSITAEITTTDPQDNEPTSVQNDDSRPRPRKRRKVQKPVTNTTAPVPPGPGGDAPNVSVAENNESRPRPRKKRNKKPKITFPWVHNKDFSPQLFEFDNSNSGIDPNVDLDETSSNLKFFLEMFPLDLVSHIVEQTNLYFTEVVSHIEDVSLNELNNWKPVDENEMLCFLALCILMSHVRKNEIRDYWSTDKLIETKIFREVMSRNRFQAILRMLHFNNSNVTNPQLLGRLHKINPILCSLNKHMSDKFTPFEKLAIDETLFLYKGKLAFRQYIPKKRARFGIKLFVLSDCDTSLVLHVLPYVGAQTNLGFPGLEGIGVTGQVVLTLLEPFFGLGHKVYLDNWYVSPCLAMELFKHNVNMCGTVLPDRQGLPKKLPSMEIGEVDVHHTEIMMYERWQDKREVRMLTTMHDSELTESGKTNWETGEKIKKPKSVLDYNANMGAVDVGDMELSFNVTARKTIKWYKKLFFHLLDIAIRNSHIMKKMKTGGHPHLSDFRKELVREILEVYCPARTQPLGGRPSPRETPLRLNQRHFLEPIPAIPTNPRPRRKCHVCRFTKRKPSKRTDTYYMCVSCDVPLCISPCMKDFHTLRHF